MSGIYFHVERHDANEVRVSGSERAYAGGVMSNLLIASLNVGRHSSELDPIYGMCSAPYLVNNDSAWAYDALLTWLHVAQGHFSYRGREISVFDCALNTALLLGNDAIKLLARLHGQCEIHTYVEEKNRYWLADIISTGLEQNILRENMGWESVIALLRDIISAPGPVVTSYSVTESFPNAEIAGVDVSEDDGLDDTGWYALPNSEQWRLSMLGLRQHDWLEMKPETWNTYHFTDGVTGYDIRVEAYKLLQQ